MQRFLMKLIIILIFFYSTIVRAETLPEEILNFDSYIRINKNASLDITETIKVKSNQNRIRHGIVRWLPRQYIDSYGIKHQTDYQLGHVLLNGKAVTFTISKQQNQFVIIIGDRNNSLSTGEYTYSLQYHVKNAIDFLNNREELYWNITGNSWDFPIAKVTANIQLPLGAQITQYNAFTGKLASKGKNYSVIHSMPNQIVFTTRSPLQRGQSLTVEIAWPKGIVIPIIPYSIKIIDPKLAIETTLILFFYFLIVWILYGRKIQNSFVKLIAEPPLNLSPAAMRFIHRMGYDLKVVSVALVSMATKNYLTIDNKNGKICLKKTGYGFESLSDDEKNLAQELFRNNESLELSEEHRVQICNVEASFKSFFKKKFHNVYFMTNLFYLIPGWFFGLVGLFTLMVATEFFHFLPSLLFGLLIITVIINLLFFYLIKTPTPAGRQLLNEIQGFKLYLSSKQAVEKNPEQFLKLLPYAIALSVEKEWEKQFKEIQIKVTNSPESYQPAWYNDQTNTMLQFSRDLSNTISSAP